MDKKEYEIIDAVIDEYDDLPDGAFLAALSERGISTEKLEEYSKASKIYNPERWK